MTSATTDQIGGLGGSVALKAPVRAATTGPIILAEEQTVGGVACVTGDRVLVKDQASAADNGIYVVSTGNWERARDFDGSRDIVQGTLVPIASSTTLYRLTTAAPLVGSSALAFAVTGNGTLSSQDADDVAITGGSITGITDLAVADGGTGASTAAGARTNLGLGSIAVQSAGAVAITGGSISDVDLTIGSNSLLTVPNVGLHLLDTDGTHDLVIKPGSNLTADRTLTITTGDADRTLTIEASATIGADISAIEALSSTGLAARTGSASWAQRTITGTADQITVSDGNGVSGNPTLTIPTPFNPPGDVNIGTNSLLTVANVGLHLLDTDGTHDLVVKPGSNLTADRTLTITTGDADRTLTIEASATIGADISAIEALSSTGLAARTGSASWAQRTITGTADQITVSDGNGVSGNPTLTIPTPFNPPGDVNIGSNSLLTVANVGLHLLDTDGTHDLVIKPGSNLTADRTLTLTTGDADRTLAIEASATVGGDVTALEALSSTGIAVRSGSEIWSLRTITGTANQISVADGDGAQANPTLSLPSLVVGTALHGSTSVTAGPGGLGVNDSDQSHFLLFAAGSNLSANRTLTVTTGDANRTLTIEASTTVGADISAIEALASTGLAARTGSGTWAQRSVAAGTGLSVANGDGVSGNPTVSLGTAAALFGQIGVQFQLGTISDDAIATFNPQGTSAFIVLLPNLPGTRPTALFTARQAATAAVDGTKIGVGTVSFATTSLAGTTGADGALNIGVTTTDIYVENRTGGAVSYTAYVFKL